MASLLNPQSAWMFPANGQVLNANTPPTSMINHYFVQPNRSQETPLSIFLRATELSVQMTQARFAGSGLIIGWVDARVMVQMSYHDPNGAGVINTGFMSLNNNHHATTFSDIVLNIDSFDILVFQASPWVEAIITLSFNFVVRPIAQPLIRQDVNVGGMRAAQNRMTALHNFRNVRGVNSATGFARLRGKGYKEIKRKMFHKRSLDDFYHHTDSIMKVPETDNGFCFPMAFFKSQLRLLLLNNCVEETKEASTLHQFEDSRSTNLNWMTAEDHFDPYNCPLQMENDCLESEFYAENNGGKFLPFNPYKKVEKVWNDGFKEFYADTTEEYNVNWYLAAMDMHVQVEEYFGHEIDWTMEEIVCKKYSEFFHCHIHLYSLSGKGERYNTYIREGDRRFCRHIHILVEGEHCSAITNIRHFMASTSGSGQLSLHNFCDMCTKTTTSNKTYEMCLPHLRKCVDTNHECLNVEISKFKDTFSKDLRARSLFSRETLYSCSVCGFDRKKKISPDCKENHYPTAVFAFKCVSCHFEVLEEDQGDHQCFITIPTIKDPIEDMSVWCYDIESMSNPIGEALVTPARPTVLNVLEHTTIAVILFQAYGEEEFVFSTFEAFCDFVHKDDRFDNSTILAHNGGGYDHQYVLAYCERLSILHNITPHASSKHKFLRLEMVSPTGGVRSFIDSIAFVPGALKKIGQDFGLSVAKGDFPHNFSRRQNLYYRGSMPPLHSVEDYFGFQSKRSEGDQEELQEWYDRESVLFCSCPMSQRSIMDETDTFCIVCGLPPWDFQKELIKYCKLDVQVLAQFCVKYREEIRRAGKPEDETFNWNYPGLDPFTYLTQSQIAITAFLNGHTTPIQVACSQYSLREGYNEKSNNWLHRIQGSQPDKRIIYKGNSIKEWYCPKLDSFFPGFCKETNTVYIFYDCDHENCLLCHEGRNTHRGLSSEEIHRRREFELGQLKLTLKYNVSFIWEHEYDGYMLDEEYKECRVMNDRDFFYGGRTEVFSCFAQSSPTKSLFYHDIVSEYPTVCAFGELPLTHPLIYYGRDVEPERLSLNCPKETQYWGFVLCRVRPNKNDILGMLPSRDLETNRLQFTVQVQTGSWHTCELLLAIECGYIVEEIIQVKHWTPQMRSSTFMRGYISNYLRMKQEAEGWKKAGASSESPDEGEQARVIEDLFQKNGGIGRMRPECVAKSPVKRAIAKLMLNCLWGKFVQKKQEDYFVTINGYKQYMYVMNHPDVDLTKVRFRHVNGNIFKITLKKRVGYEMCNNKYNIWIGASVTAQARCMLHRRMLFIGPENVVYCDTDSIIGLQDRDNPVPTGMGLGSWANEYPEKEILTFYGFAPKSYNLEFDNGTKAVKTKGICLTMENQQKLDKENMGKMIEGVVFYDREASEHDQIKLKNMNISSNSRYAQLPYGTMLTLYNDKIMRPVLTKRKLIRYFGDSSQKTVNRDFKRVRLVPRGYCEGEEHERELAEVMYSDV